MSADVATPAAAPRLALFDLDGTLLAGDTDVLWCEFLIEEGVLDREAFAAANREVADRYARGEIAAAEFAAFYAATLAGRSPAQWSSRRERFVAAKIVPRIGAASVALVSRHRGDGDRIVLTTATNRFLTAPIAALLGIVDLVATDLEVGPTGAFTGRTAGVVNMREGKVARIADWLAGEGLGVSTLASATFYSDSINDLPLLCAVATPIVVDPDARLKADAMRRGWPIISLLG
ncbi:MAG TPA: HAD-IB family hydrolase [Caldimonas sp.]|nr:HAD-IB family hydrolase [Caldimonas sp.]